MIDWSLLVGCVIGVVAGLPIGYFLGFRRVSTEDGESLLLPVIDNRPLRQRIREADPRQVLRWAGQRWLAILMVSMVLVGLAQIMTVSYYYRTCTDQLWDTIADRSAISADTEAARRENDKAVHDWAQAWLDLSEQPNAGERRDRAIVTLREFVDTYNDNVARQDANARKRADKPFQRC